VRGHPTLERTIEGFRGFTSCLQGAKEKGIVYGTGGWNAGDIKASHAMKEGYEMGGSLQGDSTAEIRGLRGICAATNARPGSYRLLTAVVQVNSR
jgi:hypothetical protein